MQELNYWVDWITKRKDKLNKSQLNHIEKAIEITKKIYDSEKGVEVWALIDEIQHFFKPEEVGQWLEVPYEGNISACKRHGIKKTNGRYMKTSEIEKIKLDKRKNVCKRCLEVYENTIK